MFSKNLCFIICKTYIRKKENKKTKKVKKVVSRENDFVLKKLKH